MKNLKTFLTTKKFYKNVEKIYALIGADPAIGKAGWALVFRVVLPDHQYQDYVVEAGTIEPNSKDYLSNKLHFLMSMFEYRIFEIREAIHRHNLKELKTVPQIEFLGGGLEVPGYLKGGMARINRDLVQRDAITAMRLAYKKQNTFIVGDDDDEPIRPNQVHALAGVAGKKDTDDFNKKQAVFEWLQQNTIIIPELDKAGDASDAAGIAIVGLNKMLGAK